MSKEDAVKLLLQRGRACFDHVYYKQQYTDLGNSFTQLELWLHYVKYGQFENRLTRYADYQVYLMCYCLLCAISMQNLFLFKLSLWCRELLGLLFKRNVRCCYHIHNLLIANHYLTTDLSVRRALMVCNRAMMALWQLFYKLRNKHF